LASPPVAADECNVAAGLCAFTYTTVIKPATIQYSLVTSRRAERVPPLGKELVRTKTAPAPAKALTEGK